MASGASIGRLSAAAVVFTVIEYRVEPLFELHWKSFDGRIVRVQIGVATNAYRLLFGDPLVHMTADARFVPSKSTVDAFHFSRVARITRKFRVLRNFMRKSGKGSTGIAGRNRIRDFG